jgi:hypothetical protein
MSFVTRFVSILDLFFCQQRKTDCERKNDMENILTLTANEITAAPTASILWDCTLNPEKYLLPKKNGLLHLSDNSKMEKVALWLGIDKKYIKAVGLPSKDTCDGMGDVEDNSICAFCYAWSMAHQYKDRFKTDWHNYAVLVPMLGNVDKILDILRRSIPEFLMYFRMQDSGDNVSAAYIKAWVKLAEERPGTIFYGYTKSLHMMYNVFVKEGIQAPDNFRVSLSSGANKMNEPYRPTLNKIGFRNCFIIWSDEYEQYKHLPFNNIEREAIFGKTDFIIGVHGTGFKKGTREYESHKFFTKLGKELGISCC